MIHKILKNILDELYFIVLLSFIVLIYDNHSTNALLIGVIPVILTTYLNVFGVIVVKLPIG